MATKVGLPVDGLVWHFHPIGILAHLFKPRPKDDLSVLRGQVTIDAEGNDVPTSIYFSRRLHWPGGASGVTLGRGYDMKHRSWAAIKADLIAAGVEAEAAEKFALGAGLSGPAADEFVNSNRVGFGEITREAQRILFESIIYPRYESDAQKRYSDAAAVASQSTPWEELHDRIKDIAVDLTYQQGSIWDRQIPQLARNSLGLLAKYIRETPELAQYEAGRQRAVYLLRGDLD
ncbi:pesticin C-terminus-like muramidase [Pseudomonas knackmussii]|uniref:pesticin C-terminus-like muramidase n=1 Tax=Pseudomonas knackmussii TaxID=65741 RepID=UPI001362B6BE|nr:pesticin C-terminus-like muramidase [Pseudomonas knackmussii]